MHASKSTLHLALLLGTAVTTVACIGDTFMPPDDSGTPDALPDGGGDAASDPDSAPDAPGSDGGADAAPATFKLVFITSETFTGNLGGTSGADATCTMLAHNAGHAGTFAAWVSTVASPVTTRFAHSTLPYQLVDGTTVANEWGNLISGTIFETINLDEHGSPIAFSVTNETGITWTGTEANGTVDPTSSDLCADWTTTDSSAGHDTLIGYDNAASSSWTAAARDACNVAHSLYCFQQ